MSPVKFAFAASLALMLSACGGNDTPSPTAPTPPTTNNPPPASGTTVTIPAGASTAGTAGFGMNPITIATGTTVTWRNSDAVAHTATADAAGGFNTGNIAANATASFTFTTAGTVKYHCAIHPGMLGTITVQ
jgi:plastocyanin